MFQYLDRHDFITLLILYWNWYKIERMPLSLDKQLLKVGYFFVYNYATARTWLIKCLQARTAVADNLKEMNNMLEEHQLTIEDLPLILEELTRKAKLLIDKRQTKKTPLDKLKVNLEGLYIQLKNVSMSISKVAGNIYKK